MESYKNKIIPPFEDSYETQEEYCENSQCMRIQNIDCGGCLFSTTFSKNEFNEWKDEQDRKCDQ